jgi:ribonuclease BN (tRNA processing enzyme)
MSPVQVTFLGTGDAFSPSGLNQAAYLIQGRDTAILLDCGMTTLTSMKRNRMDPAIVDAVVLSHFHGDHFGGLPSLLLQYKYLEERKRPLVVAGPPGVGERCIQLCAALYADALQTLPFPVTYVELKPQQLSFAGSAQLLPFAVPHSQFFISLGLEICMDGRKIIYSGDSGWNNDLTVHARGADLFLCECTFYSTQLETHICYQDLAKVKDSLSAKRIVLTHLGEEILAHRHELELETAEDGMQIEL